MSNPARFRSLVPARSEPLERRQLLADRPRLRPVRDPLPGHDDPPVAVDHDLRRLVIAAGSVGEQRAERRFERRRQQPSPFKGINHHPSASVHSHAPLGWLAPSTLTSIAPFNSR